MPTVETGQNDGTAADHSQRWWFRGRTFGAAVNGGGLTGHPNSQTHHLEVKMNHPKPN